MNEQEVLTKAKELTLEFIAQLGLDAEVTVEYVAGEVKEGKELKYIMIKMDGEHLSELIGFHGKVFDSVQNILGLLISRSLQQPDLRTLIEINDYRSKREEYLKMYAKRAAEEVRMNGQSMELPPMKPFERRIVHMVLKEDLDVMTESSGVGEERRIKILPRN
jgi:spoIIIJ-associated protein